MRTNWRQIVPTNATFTCCDEVSTMVMNTTCCITCCDGAEDAFPRDVVGLIVVSLMTGLCLLGLLSARKRENSEILELQAQAVEHTASQERRKERRRKRKESISNGLIVKEWVLDGAPVVGSRTEGDQDNPAPLGETVESWQPPALPVSASSVSCVGSDDCESLEGGEEMTGCAICLSHFKPQQLVCESNNSSCQHVFHKDCMVDWLTKPHDDCPMCREVYVLQMPL
jgi:hypothetical protein